MDEIEGYLNYKCPEEGKWYSISEEASLLLAKDDQGNSYIICQGCGQAIVTFCRSQQGRLYYKHST